MKDKQGQGRSVEKRTEGEEKAPSGTLLPCSTSPAVVPAAAATAAAAAVTEAGAVVCLLPTDTHRPHTHTK